MITITIAGEETIELTDNHTVNNISSFQNTSSAYVRWSTEIFSETNQGSILSPRHERVFSDATTVYFKEVVMGKVHCRSEIL